LVRASINILLRIVEVKVNKMHLLKKNFSKENIQGATMSYKLNVKGILFDLDGTILDTKSAYIEAAKTAFIATGQPLPETDVALEIPRRLEQKLSFSDIVKVDRQIFLGEYLKAFYAISQYRSKPIAGVAEVLELLSRKTKLALITLRHAPNETIIAELDHFGLSKYFTHVVTALDTLKPKPSPEALIKAVTSMHLQICDCVIVGDSVIDVKAGEAAGIKTVAVLSGLYSHAELSKANPSLLLNDVTELPQYIQ
jgi:phosphoglycolate phosphatase